MSPQIKSPFQLPTPVKVSVVYVRLANGSIVARTPDELAALPDDLRSELVLLPKGD